MIDASILGATATMVAVARLAWLQGVEGPGLLVLACWLGGTVLTGVLMGWLRDRARAGAGSLVHGRVLAGGATGR